MEGPSKLIIIVTWVIFGCIISACLMIIISNFVLLKKRHREQYLVRMIVLCSFTLVFGLVLFPLFFLRTSHPWTGNMWLDSHGEFVAWKKADFWIMILSPFPAVFCGAAASYLVENDKEREARLKRQAFLRKVEEKGEAFNDGVDKLYGKAVERAKAAQRRAEIEHSKTELKRLKEKVRRIEEETGIS